MDTEIIKDILKIDNLAKENIKSIEEKNKEIDKYINGEITAKEVALEAKAQEKILKLTKDFENSLAEQKELIKEQTSKELNEKINKFETEKEQKEEKIVNSILKEVVSNNGNNN